MRVLLACLALVALVTAIPVPKNFIDEINSKQNSWVAGENKYFEGMSENDIRRFLGATNTRSVDIPYKAFDDEVAVPAEFNAGTQWKNCSTISHIYDQGECGSCWAFGCVAAVSDRFCINSKASINYAMSFQQMTSCGPGDGCEGGEAGSAWDYVERDGLVSDSAYPYAQPTCAPADQPCMPDTFKPTLPCRTPSSTRHKLSKVYRVPRSNMQQEMFANGPVEVCFTVYADFVHYKSGVYKHTSGSALGGHCVKMIGWGSENGEDYWICNNSWTTTWGDNGTFKIAKGQCGIEDDVVAGTPSL